LKYKELHIDALIKACEKNDQNAQMELYQRYHQPLYQAAYSILKNRDDAQDAMQEGMIKAFEKLDQFQGEGNFGGWLRKIVVRKSIAYYHYNKRMLGDIYLENREELSVDPEEDNSSFPSFKPEQLDHALAQLNERYSLILKLYYLEGYTHEELSELLDWSYNNCRTTLSRAKKQLKKILNEGARA
jgi:RNA polymerase sigma-70 factor (ECF subfamily)